MDAMKDKRKCQWMVRPELNRTQGCKRWRRGEERRKLSEDGCTIEIERLRHYERD
jgi:hypothetical protein